MVIEPTVKNDILAASKVYTDPGGSKLQVIGLNEIINISRMHGQPLLSVEITSLMLGIIPMRYVRNLGTIGRDGQLKLLLSHVAVAGLGGLGGIVVELLARAGVGHLTIIDNGRFTENNLNRQLLATEGLIGKSKVKAAKIRIKRVNSSVIVKAINSRINSANCDDLISEADVVIDALDNLPSRFILADSCRKLNRPLIHGAIAGFGGQLMTILPGEKGLKELYGSLESDRLYGIEAVTGNPPTTAAIIGALQVQETIKLITGIGTNICKRILMLDFAENLIEEVTI